MDLRILTPEKKIYSGMVEMVRVPGTKGLFQILKDHAPIISTLDKGLIRIRDMTGEIQNFPIKSGYIKCIKNQITILIQE